MVAWGLGVWAPSLPTCMQAGPSKKRSGRYFDGLQPAAKRARGCAAGAATPSSMPQAEAGEAAPGVWQSSGPDFHMDDIIPL